MSRYLKLIEMGDAGATEAAKVSEPDMPPTVIEATFIPASAPSSPAVVAPEFPLCPVCGQGRYWLSRGKVMCGSKTCYSAVRFILTSVEYHAIN